MEFYTSEQKVLKNYLEHYGVKGMKWGVLRSLQNRNVGRGMSKLGTNTANNNSSNTPNSTALLNRLVRPNVGSGMRNVGANTTNNNQSNSVGSGANALSTAVRKQTYLKSTLSKNANNRPSSNLQKRLLSDLTTVGDGSSNIYNTGLMPYNNVGNNSLVALSSGKDAISEEKDEDKKEDMIDKIKKSIKSLFSFKIIDIDKDKVNDAKKAVQSFFSKLKR
jgi:hypothetical protein